MAATAKRTSFQKRVGNVGNLIKGTKPSLHNSQLLISSGIPSFDALIGGGFPVGSLILINEDECGAYGKYFLKYFLTEGIVSKHSTFVCSADADPEDMVQKLPNPVDADTEDETEGNVSDKKMTIAWRYENLKPVSSSSHSHSYFGHYFDLSKKIEEKILSNANIEYWSGTKAECSGESFQASEYWYLLQSIKDKLTREKCFAAQETPTRNILRIGLHSMNSPMWQKDLGDDRQNDVNFYTFLYSLRALLRNAYGVCLLTLPFSNFNKVHNDKCIHFVDVAVQLQSFAGTKCEKLAPYKDYHGMFVIQKLAAINSLMAFKPGVTNLAFKLKRKKLIIEEFHLPPEFEDSTEREQDDSAVLTCSSMKSNKYDF